MSWKPEVDEIEKRRQRALEMGGPEAVERQHAAGRLNVRERIEGLIDPGSLHEVGPQAGSSEHDEASHETLFTPANYVLGLARIDGRPCAVGGEDFTQRGGSPSPAGLRKSVFAEELACRYRVPLVRFLEGGGGSITGTRGKDDAKQGPRPAGEPFFAPHRFASIARVLREVPVVSAAVGPVAGFPAARLAASHFAVMVRDTSQVMIGGPALVERAMEEKLTKEELGGAKVHLRSGVVDCAVQSEAEVFEAVRRFLSYLPTNTSQRPPRHEPVDDPARCDESLLEIIPRDRRKVYVMRKIVNAVVDEGSFFEMSAQYGRSQITGLARLDGWPVGIWANDPYFYAGSMDATGAQKVARFVRLCERFHLPIVCFVDEPGFLIGSEAERSGTIRYGVDAIVAAMESTVPWASVLVRKSYGVAAAAHYGPEATLFSWPSAEAGALPIEGGVAVAFRREIQAASDPDALRSELEERFAAGRSPFPRAEAFGVQDLLDPRRTRPALCEWLAWNEAVLAARTPGVQPSP